MHCITINFGPAGMIWTMLYKTEEAAAQAFSVCSNAEYSSMITLTDDFGQTARFITKGIHGVLFENLDLSKVAHVEKGLHNARTQADYQKRASADPAVRSAMQGPAVLSPMGGNGMFRQ